MLALQYIANFSTLSCLLDHSIVNRIQVGKGGGGTALPDDLVVTTGF